MGLNWGKKSQKRFQLNRRTTVEGLDLSKSELFDEVVDCLSARGMWLLRLFLLTSHCGLDGRLEQVTLKFSAILKSMKSITWLRMSGVEGLGQPAVSPKTFNSFHTSSKVPSVAHKLCLTCSG
jgi:hypothetical protein